MSCVPPGRLASVRALDDVSSPLSVIMVCCVPVTFTAAYSASLILPAIAPASPSVFLVPRTFKTQKARRISKKLTFSSHGYLESLEPGRFLTRCPCRIENRLHRNMLRLFMRYADPYSLDLCQICRKILASEGQRTQGHAVHVLSAAKGDASADICMNA